LGVKSGEELKEDRVVGAAQLNYAKVEWQWKARNRSRVS